MGRGVIVYGNDVKAGLTTFKNLSLYGLALKKNPLVPAHRTGTAGKTLLTFANTATKVGDRIGEYRLPYN